MRKVKKETVNKDRLFFCCAQEDSCNYFEWVPEEPYCNAKLPQSEIKQDEKHKEQYPTEDFINDLANVPINSKLQHPPQGRPWEFDSKSFPGVGNLTMFRVGRGI